MYGTFILLWTSLPHLLAILHTIVKIVYINVMSSMNLLVALELKWLPGDHVIRILLAWNPDSMATPSMANWLRCFTVAHSGRLAELYSKATRSPSMNAWWAACVADALCARYFTRCSFEPVTVFRCFCDKPIISLWLVPGVQRNVWNPVPCHVDNDRTALQPWTFETSRDASFTCSAIINLSASPDTMLEFHQLTFGHQVKRANVPLTSQLFN